MGQSTFATIGVSVSLPLIYRHIKLINKLCDITKICVYVSGLSDEPDETVDFDIIEDFGLDLDSIYDLAEKENEEEFKKHCEELEIKEGLVFHFIYNCASVYARNLNFRNNPNLFSEDDGKRSPADIITNFQEGMAIFMAAGVPEDYIKAGNTINES